MQKKMQSYLNFLPAAILLLPLFLSSQVAANYKAVVEPNLLSNLFRVIAANEYHVTATARGLQAPNRAQNLRTYFSTRGIVVVDRTSPASPVLARVAFKSLGRGRNPKSNRDAPKLFHQKNHVEIHRQDLVEWYRNTPTGLEQGFTLAKRLPGKGALRLNLSVEQAIAHLHNGEIVLTATATGRNLQYGKLVVKDAFGRLLPAHMATPNKVSISLIVDDRDAVYPVVIDPIITAMDDVFFEGEQANAFLGFSVAFAGDVNGDGFDDVIVGAEQYDSGDTNEGAAFVFLGSATGLADATPASAHAVLESDQLSARMGTSVAGAGDVNGDGFDDVIVGAAQYDNGQTNEGAAFVFLGSATGLADATPAGAHATLESDQASGQMGTSVASAGDVNGDGFDDVIIGASLFDNGQANEGAAFVFLGTATGLVDATPASAHAILESNQLNAQMGTRVAGVGDVNGDGFSDVMVGALLYDSGQNDEGAAFVFLGSATGLVDANPTSAHAFLQSNQAGAVMGAGVAGAGDVNGDGFDDVIVGARDYDSGQNNEGAAFVFLGSATGLDDATPATAHATLESDQVGALMGKSVAGAGDVNGDGFDDVIVGAESYDNGQTNEGAAFVFLGSATGLDDATPATAHAILESDQSGASMGISVAGAGDVDGDGADDVIVGASSYDNGQTNEGAAFIYLGTPPGGGGGGGGGGGVIVIGGGGGGGCFIQSLILPLD